MPLADRDAAWLNEPTRWRRSGGDLLLTTEPGSDFWRTTHFGFVRDSGHHLGVRVPGEFTCQVTVMGDYRDQFDQAGLMVRLDAERWVKCGLELVDGVVTMSTVVTHAVSDWSTTPLGPVGLPVAAAEDADARPAEALRLRVRRQGDALSVEYAVGEAPWTMHRMAYLPPGLPVSVGPMAASPQGPGFEVRFRGWELSTP